MKPLRRKVQQWVKDNANTLEATENIILKWKQGINRYSRLKIYYFCSSIEVFLSLYSQDSYKAYVGNFQTHIHTQSISFICKMRLCIVL